MTRKRILSIALLLCMLMSIFALPGAIPAAGAANVDKADTSANVEVAETAATSNGLASSIQNGQILQAWCWSYNNVRNNLSKIADQGFTAVQVSPIQPIKESTTEYWSTLMNSSWVVYQPVAFTIETNYMNAQGTKAEFTAMCKEAHKYGVKIIVDTVFNHTANDMSGNTIHPWVPSDLRDNPDCWHDITKNTYNYDDRYEVTQYCMMGLPDLNTANSTVQWHCTNFMKEAIYCGADGFRFDAAKHIETPWDSYCGSNFWPNVLNAATSYAQSTRGITPFYYGEVLGSAGGGLSIEAYTQYMNVSDPGISDNVRNGVCNGNASAAASGGTGNGAAQNKVVQWTESHDNHKDSGTRFISDDNINKTWAMLGSKSEICALYLARPSNMDTTKMGDADWTSWTSPAVKAINRFKNHFEGQSEYLSSYYNLACVERGDSGMIIVNTGGSYYNGMSAPVHTMMDGTYKDAITGNTFTVSGGWITGDIGSTGIAVVYHGNNAGIFSPGNLTGFSLCGTFNKWDETKNVFLADTSSIASTTISLSAGTYTFKVRSGDVWYGNSGTISDTTDYNGSSNPWEFSATVDNDCTLKASGGRYKFIYDAPNRKLEVKRLSSSATCASTFYVKGDFNGWGTSNQMYYDNGTNSVTAKIQLEPGTYGFKLNNTANGIWYGNWGTIVSSTTSTSDVGWEMDPSGSVSNCTLQVLDSGEYLFTFNLSTKMLFVYNVIDVTATFVDWDGTVLKTEVVDAGDAPTAPANPSRTGYTFTGWSPSVDTITSDTTFTAQYTINSYAVSATSAPTAGGTTTASASKVNYGGEVTLKAAPDTANNYSFTNWQISGSYTISSGSLTSTSITIAPTSAITAVANYTQAATYTVTKSASTGGSASASVASVVQGDSVTLSATPSTGYTFSGWTISGNYTAVSGSATSKSFTIMPSSDITVKANFTGNQSTVKFSASTGGSVTNTSAATITYPNSASSTATASTGYKFSSWIISGGTLGTDYEITSGSTSSTSISIRPITAGKTITATASFTGITATVKFSAGTGGSVTNSGSNSVTYPATKASTATASTGYTFSGWTVSGGTQNTDYKITAGGETNASITIQPLTAGKTITATASFTQKSYVVTFVNYDGTVLSTQSVKHGDAATAPEDPTRSGYMFTGWDKDFSNVTAAMTVTAKYATDIVYLMGDFNSWDTTKGVMTNKSSNVVTKTYTLDAGTYEFKILRAGTWYGNWGTIEDTTATTSSVGWEMSSSAPNCVLKTTGGTYVFNYYKSTGMLEILHEVPTYTVTFMNYNGVTLKTETVKEGSSATAPEDPTRASSAQYDYAFTGWDTDFSNISSDLTVTAQFVAVVRQYTVNFVDYDGTVIKTQKVNYGSAATAPDNPTRSATAQYTYTFKAWDKSFSNITADTTVTATYSQTVNKYTVKFVNYDGSVLKSESVQYGSSATAPTTTPTRPADDGCTYTFAGWDKSFSNITGNLTVTAVFNTTSSNYTVTFKNYDGTVLKTQSVAYGGSATAPAAPTRPSTAQYDYTFSGWDKSFTNITGDTVITAQYTQTLVEYYVVFLDYYGDVLSEQMVPYGSDAVAPEVPDVEDGGYRYVFTEWDTDYTNIQADTPVFALYEEEALTYTVTFKNYDGTVLSTQSVANGSAATAPANPTRSSTAQYTYTFKGWDKSFSKITADTVITATYTQSVRNYTVTFKNYDGTVLKTESVPYGSAATAPADPTREGCIFKGWDIDFSKVTTDLTITAMFVDDTLYLLGDFNNWTVASATPLTYDYGTVYSTSLSLDEGTYEFKIIHSGVWLGNYGTIEDTTTTTSDVGWEMLEGADNCTLKVSGGIYHFYYDKSTKMLEIYHEIPEYVVTFANYDGSVIDTQSVAEGEAAVEPELPTRSANAQYTYSFRSWDRSFDCIVEDTLVTAQYSRSINKYTVTFKDYDGTVISTQQVEYGSAATAPATPTRTNYVFTGWSEYFGFIVADTIVVAQYADARTYLVGDFNDWQQNTVMTKGSGVVVSTTLELAAGEYEFKVLNREKWYGNTGAIDDTTITTSDVGWEMLEGASNCTLKASGGTYTFNYNTSTNMLEVIYKSNSYIVTFVDYDGTILKTQAVAAGNSATAPATPTRAATAQYTYTFKGWDKSFTNIQADTTVTATYSSKLNSYTVKFVDYDGTVLSTQTVEYGKSATAPATPERAANAQYTYTFKGWDKGYSFIAQDVNVTAVYNADVNKYTVTFVNYDGSVLSSQQVEYGTSATAPATPTRMATAQYTYTFKEWDKDFSNITSNVTVQAVYSQAVNSYFVTFANYDGTVLSTQTVEYGKSAISPKAPTRESTGKYTYTFKAWDKDFSNITGNLTIKATFTQELKKFTVLFLGIDSEVLSEQTVEYGSAATAPTAPEVSGYVFIGWDTDFSEITSDTVVFAEYEEKMFYIAGDFNNWSTDSAISVNSKGVVAKTMTLSEGKYEFKILAGNTWLGNSGTIEDTTNKTSTSGWAMTENAGNCTLNATGGTYTFEFDTATNMLRVFYTAPTYTVTFVDYNGTVLKTQPVSKGNAATAPADPTRSGYNFLGWDTDFSNIKADTTVTATYEKRAEQYTVTFVNYDGTVLKTQTVTEGSAATAPADPTRAANAQYTFTFAGWDKDFSRVTSSITVKAIYTSTVNKYTVVFKDYNGTVLSTQTVEYGKSATAPADPSRSGYYFAGWDTSYSVIRSNTTVTALYSEMNIEYTVTFVNYNGSVLKTEIVTAGSSATAPEDPTRTANAQYSYTFAGWDTDFSKVTSDLTVTATFNRITNKYTVTFKDHDGTVLSTQQIAYGNAATAPADPTREGYNFTGWSRTFSYITTDTTVTAEYTEIPKVYYTVTFLDYDGAVIDTQQVECGDSAIAPAEPVREGYTFKAWDKDFSSITADTTVTAQYTKDQVVAASTGSLRVRVTGGRGFTIAVDGGNARPQGANYYNSKLPMGATVTLTADPVSSNNATGSRFIGWMNPATGVIVSTELSYTFVVTGNDSLNALFSIVVEGVQMVSFKNDKANRILDSQYYSSTDTIEFPDAPTQIGFDFAGWSMTEEEIKAAITNGEDVTVVAKWTRAIVPVEVTVVGGTGSGTYNANNAVTVTANEPDDGQKFAYWTDEDGNIRSYNAEYTFFPSEDTTVTAVFVDEDTVIDYQILVSLDSIDTTSVADKNVFTYSWYCPDGYTFVKAGIVAVNKDNYNEATFVAGSSDGNVYDRSPSGANLKPVNTYTWTKSNIASGQTWRAMAYVQYKDASGQLVTVYSDVVEATKD